MTTVCFGAIEAPNFLRRLQALDVRHLAVNASRLRKRNWRLIDHLADFDLLVAFCDLQGDLDVFTRWVEANRDERMLEVFPPGAELPDHPRAVPTWDGHDTGLLLRLCKRYDRLAVGRDVLRDEDKTRRLVSIARKQATRLIGFTGSPVEADEARLDIVVNTAWVNTMRYGVTHVWDGRVLHNYEKAEKEAARTRHRADIERLGIFWEGVRDDEDEAVVALSVASWNAWAEARSRPVATMEPESGSGEVLPFTPRAIATEPAEIPVEPRPRERTMLPVAAMGSMALPAVEDGHPSTLPVLRSNRENVRQCDTCALAGRCPKYEEHAACAFDAPVAFENVSQILGVAQFGLEVHVQRLMFALFAEQIEGQVLDPRVSAEIDRLYTILGKLKDLSDNSDELTIRMKTKAGAGRVAALFGSEAATRAAKLPGGGLDAQGSDRLLGEIFDVMGEPSDT